MESDTAVVFPLEIDGKIHSLLRIPPSLPESITEKCGPNPRNLFNILMADVSGSMSGFFDKLADGWTQIVSPTLQGIFKCYFLNLESFELL